MQLRHLPAGVFMENMQKSRDGFEMTWAVNVVAPFLLTSLLLGNVKERIINISSISAGSRVDWSNLQQVRSRPQLQVVSTTCLRGKQGSAPGLLRL